MHFNSKEGLIITSALIIVTILVTIFLQNSITKAIEKKAIALGSRSNEIESFSSLINKNKNDPKDTVSEIRTVVQPSSKPQTSPSPPPIGSGKKWTPL